MVNKIVSILALFIFLLLNLDSTAQERNYFLNGKVIDHGKYDELVKKNHKFRRMAKHA